MPKGGARKGAGRKPKGERPLVKKTINMDEKARASFKLAHDNWHTEAGGTEGDFFALLLAESERVEDWGV